jgi:hypothetical protein
MKYTRLYSGEDGFSHFEDITVEKNAKHYEKLDDNYKGTSFELFNAQHVIMGHIEQQAIDWHHPPCARLLVIYLNGYIEMEVSNGEIRRFGPGDSCLIEDALGKGHLTRITESEGLRYYAIPLKD